MRAIWCAVSISKTGCGTSAGGGAARGFYDVIDVPAQPSTYEPFGLAALEAAARGIPLVRTRIDGLAEVLGDHAFYCEDTSYESFREAMYRWRKRRRRRNRRHDRRCAPARADSLQAQRYRDRFTVLEAENQGLSGP
jgi:glycosyltransferase involved in cell wall biosynthesis